MASASALADFAEYLTRKFLLVGGPPTLDDVLERFPDATGPQIVAAFAEAAGRLTPSERFSTYTPGPSTPEADA
jgi:hypothetical protein